MTTLSEVTPQHNCRIGKRRFGGGLVGVHRAVTKRPNEIEVVLIPRNWTVASEEPYRFRLEGLEEDEMLNFWNYLVLPANYVNGILDKYNVK